MSARQPQLDGLLVTRDPELVSVMNTILNGFAIDTDVCGEMDLVLDTVLHKRLDTLIVDWDGSLDPTRIVRAARNSSPNSNSTIVALVDKAAETHALLVGANFMIHKPTNVDNASRCLRAAYGTMLQNRRRSARVAVDIVVAVRIANVGPVDAHITDLSVGGLALQCARPVPINSDVLTQFPLSGAPHPIHVTGKVVNASATGRAGIRFVFVADQDRDVLDSWLATELAKIETAEMPAY